MPIKTIGRTTRRIETPALRIAVSSDSRASREIASELASDIPTGRVMLKYSGVLYKIT